jgi:ABC-type transport system substrate-binding protein
MKSYAALVGCLLGIGLALVPDAGLALQPGQNPQQPVRTEFGFDPEDNTPLVDREPFDRVIVQDGNVQYTLAVKPLNMPQPIQIPDSGMLRFELLDRAGEILQLPWELVTKIETYEEIIVAETRAAYQAGDLDRAFRNLLFLFDLHGGNDAVVRELLEQFWYRDATQLIQNGQTDLAVTVLEELYRRNPGFVGGQQQVIELLAAEYDRRMRAMAQNAEVDRIKEQIEKLEDRYVPPPGAIANVIALWKSEVEKQGQRFLDQAESVAAGNDPVEAHAAARRAVFRMPQDPRSWAMYEQVAQRFPMIFVGVTGLPAVPNARAMDDWNARRIGSLLQKQLVDLTGLGEDGGQYDFADGRIVPVDQFGLVYRFEILPPKDTAATWMTALDLANRLALLVREGSPEFYFPLAKLVASIEIVDESKVDVRLRQPFVRFESLLRVPYQASHSDRGVYLPETRTDDFAIYRPTSHSGNSGWTIVEKRFANASDGADALLAGEIDILDWVYPGDLERLRADPSITVRPYLVPSIHMLIPNQRTRFMQDQSYRRSFLYAVDREQVLRQIICGGQEIQGYEVISGPLPKGSDENDLIGYGYNEQVPNVRYNPGMAVVSPAVVIKHLRDKAAKELMVNRAIELDGLEPNEQFKLIDEWLDADESLREPALVLAHPSTELATAACQAMRQMWVTVGRKVELRALPPGQTRPDDDDYDLLYAEFTVEEPLTDLRAILGELGLAKNLSPTVEQLLSELDTVRNWVQARQVLRQVHEQCGHDVTVLPLWQTINFFAYRDNIRGLAPSEVRLYDNVERWELSGRDRH